MFLVRWLLGYTAWEWWEMPAKERIAYTRGLVSYLPHILYGSDAIERDSAGRLRKAAKPTQLSSLPGGSIVRAS